MKALFLGALLMGAWAEAREITLLFTGDNGGEVAPCGCKIQPSGGLARRKTQVLLEREKGPTLVVDAGNALFPDPGAPDDMKKARARLILSAMGQVGTSAMAVGLRDLSAGLSFLVPLADKAKVPLLSANLEKNGKRVFPASTVVTVGELTVGLIGVSAEGPVMAEPGLVGAKALPAVLEEAGRLSPQVQVVVLLAAMPYEDVLALGTALASKVDLILHSTESQGAGAVQALAHARLVPAGDRGRQVGRLSLRWSQKGAPFEDDAVVQRERQSVEMLDEKLKWLTERLSKTTEPGARATLGIELQRMRENRKQRALSAGLSASSLAPNRLRLDWVVLGPDIADEPVLKGAVDKLASP